VDFALAFADQLPEGPTSSIPEVCVGVLANEVAALRRQLAEAEAARDKYRALYERVNASAELQFHRATTAERRLEEACEQAGCDGDHAALPDAVKLIREQRDYAIYSDRVAQDALTASQQEVARLREALERWAKEHDVETLVGYFDADARSCENPVRALMARRTAAALGATLSSSHQSTGQGGGV
jgi:hypothetical protein